MPKHIDYRKRVHLRIRKKISGTAERPRVAVFRSLKHIYLQAIDDSKGATIAAISTVEKETSKSLKGKKSEVARELGKQFAAKLKAMKIETVIFDRAGFRYHGRIQSAAEGMREAGIKF